MAKKILFLIIAAVFVSLMFSGCSVEDGNNKFPNKGKNLNNNKFPNQGNSNGFEPGTGGADLGDFTPAAVPDLITTSSTTDAPVYLFLFTHTEDHTNHDLSEERYLRLAPELADIANTYSEADITWTIQFQGSDARTIVERNSDTGVVDLLRSYPEYIEFGYHGVHEPTTFNKPEYTLSNNPTWEEVVNTISSWISCQKDPYHGGCISDTGGGIQAVQQIGDVEIVSGAGIALGLFETGAGKHAIDKEIPTRINGFGFSDHGPKGTGYEGSVSSLLNILSPAADTSTTVFWMDDVIRTNDAGLSLSGKMDLKNGVISVESALKTADRSKPNIFHTGFASKYLYTAAGTSPTDYAYDNPESPELPSSLLNTESTKERYYENSIDALEYLAADYTQEENSKFVSASQITEILAPDQYWTITDSQLDVLARWLLIKAEDGTLPNYVSDGVEYYSLRDLLVLLSYGLTDNYPSTINLELAYGPLEATSPQSALRVTEDEIIQIANTIASDVSAAASSSWTTTPSNIVDSDYNVNTGTINTAQLLYAMSAIYASNYAGEGLTELTVPSLAPMPETIEYLEDLGCNNCQGSSWSLKPARFS